MHGRPSVCLVVISRWHSAACHLPSVILARDLQNPSQMEGSRGHFERWWCNTTVCTAERKAGKKDGPTIAFLPIVKYICLQPLWKAHKAAWRLKMCFLYVSTRVCDTLGNAFSFFFSLLLTPNCCLWEASVKKVVQSPKRKIEDKR